MLYVINIKTVYEDMGNEFFQVKAHRWRRTPVIEVEFESCGRLKMCHYAARSSATSGSEIIIKNIQPVILRCL